LSTVKEIKKIVKKEENKNVNFDDINERIIRQIEKAHPNCLPSNPEEVKKTKGKLKNIHKEAIVKWFAAGYAGTEIQKLLYDYGKLHIELSTIYWYKDRYRHKIAELREEVFGVDFAYIPIAQKEVRLARYEKIYTRLMDGGQLTEAANILEKARVEREGKVPLFQTGDVYTGNSRVSKMEGNINVHLEPEQAKKVDEILISAFERKNERKPRAMDVTV